MAGNTSHEKGRGESPEQQRTRVETSWPIGCRELDDLAQVAARLRGNPQRRGEANAYVIRLWSQVLHGEISSTSFWEMFGMTAQASMSAQPAASNAIPPIAAIASPTPATIPESPKEDERRANRAKNRAAQADQWSN